MLCVNAIVAAVGKHGTVLHVDHDALTDSEELFTAFTVPQLQAAIERVKHAAKQLVESRPAERLEHA